MTGIFGGTFDPPHNGHVALARRALKHFGLERLIVLVTGQTPGKPSGTDPDLRLRLAEAAFAGLPGVELSRFDVDRPQPAYTYETVRWASEEWGDVVFLVGADRFADFLSWEQPEEILRYARLGVATRPGFPREELDVVLERLQRPERVKFFEIEEVPVSARDVRARAARGEPIDALVPPGVVRLIAELNLYRWEGPQEPPLHYDQSRSRT